jgi:hypothetical protein
MNILHINFNVVLAHCYKIYQKFVCEEENPTVQWNAIEHELGNSFDKFICCDAMILEEIAMCLKKAFPYPNTAFVPIENPKDIVAFIDPVSVEIRDGVEIADKHSVVNIDIGSGLFEDDSLKETLTNKNWLIWLIDRDMINEQRVSWGRMPISIPGEELCRSLKRHEHNWLADNRTQWESDFYDVLHFASNTHFDKIYFSFSPSDVPYKFKYIYDLIVGFLTWKNEEAGS